MQVIIFYHIAGQNPEIAFHSVDRKIEDNLLEREWIYAGHTNLRTSRELFTIPVTIYRIYTGYGK
jgi:hypothetical protein